MSAYPLKSAAYPHAWLQPVRYDLDAYRQFTTLLDDDLSMLVVEHMPRRQVLDLRTSLIRFGRGGVVDSDPQLPPEQRSC